MTAERRLPLLALLWILTAAGAGLLFAWLLRTEPGVRIEFRDRDSPGGKDGNEPEARGPAPSGGSKDTSRAVSTGRDFDPTGDSVGTAAAPPSARHSWPSLLVTVQNPEGTPVEGGGTVYALSPGEPGSNDSEDLCRAEIGEDGTARLRLPEAGTYDIGASTSWGTVLAEDVKVAPGDSGTLTLRLAGDAPVRIVCDPPWPPPVENPVLTVSLGTGGARQVNHPGRGQAGFCGTQFEVGPDGTGTSCLLPSGTDFSVLVRLLETRPQLLASTVEGRQRRVRQEALCFAAEPDRETVRPGEAIRVRIRPLGVLIVEAEGVPGRPEAATSEKGVYLRVDFCQGDTRSVAQTPVAGKSRETYSEEGRSRGGAPFRPRILFRGAPGPCRLEWSGKGIRPGGRDDLVLRAGEIVQGTISFQGDSAGEAALYPGRARRPGDAEPAAEPEPLTMAAHGVPPDHSVEFYLVRPDERGEPQWHVRRGEREAEGSPAVSAILSGVPREGAVAFAVAPPDLVSGPVAAPASGPLAFSLSPGGFVLVAPEEVLPSEFGRLRVRLEDARPFLVWDHERRGLAEGEYYFAPAGEAAVSAGTVMGPFPDGRLTFQVRLGGIRLPDATATVKAGRIEVLRIRRPGE